MTAPEQSFARFRQHADARALAAVFDALAPELLLVAAHLAAAGGDAEDLVQATFLDAIEKAGRWDASRPLLPWLIGILVNHAREERRRLQRRIDASRLPRPEEPSPLDALAASEVAEQVAAGLKSLPRQLRQALTLRLVHGLTPTEIAHALGCPVATAKTRLQRGMEWLRKVLPAGIAVGLAGVVTAGKGLAAVRAVVMSKANVLVPVAAGAGAATTGVAVGVIAGGLLMKKVAAVAFAVLCVAALWVVVPRADEPARAGEGVAAVPAAVQADGSAPRSNPPGTNDSTASDRVAVSTDAAKTTGSAALEFVWKGDGTPAAGLLVSWQSWGGETQISSPLHADALGRLRLEDMPAGKYALSGNKLWHLTSIVAGEELRERIEVEPSLRVEGIVVDGEGRGIPGAEVRLSNSIEQLSQQFAISKDDGSFRGATDFGGLFWARKAGLAPSETKMWSSEGTLQLRLVLAVPGTGLHGTVLSSSGQMVSDATVTIVRTVPKDSCGAPLSLRSDARGRFASDEIGPGEYLLVAQADGHAATPLPFTVTAGIEQELLVRLAQGAAVAGIAQVAGKPARVRLDALPIWADSQQVGMTVWVTGQLFTRRALSDAEGNYRLEHVPAGSVRLDTSATQGAALSDRRMLQLQDGKTLRCDIELASGSEIHGRLVDRNDKPMPQWQVFASPVHGGGTEDITDAEGRFVLKGLDATDYTVTARPLGYQVAVPWAALANVQPGPGEVLLRARYTLEDAGWFSGVLLDGAGAPVLAATGYVTRAGEVQGMNCEVRLREDGSMELGPLPPGNYRVSIWIPDKGRINLGEHDLQPDAKIDLGTVRLPPAGTMELRFATAAGRTVAPSDLSAWDQAGNGGKVFERGSDGIFRSKPLPAGTYRVFAWGDDFARFDQQVVIVGERATMTTLTVTAATPVHFEMPRPDGTEGAHWTAAVSLQIKGTDGKTVGSQYLSIDTEGTFVWTRGFVRGSYTYEASLQPDGAPVRGAFTVTGDAGEQRVEIRLPAKAK